MARVLVLDDETLIAMMVEEWLAELGHETVGPANSVASALRLIDSGPIDGAIVDLSLAGETSSAVAEVLTEKGIPFAFCTGHGTARIPARFAAAPVLAKPFDFDAVRQTLAELLRERTNSAGA